LTVNKTVAFEMIQDSLNDMQQARVLDAEVELQDDTVLLGSGSPLDSLAFVTLISELESRLAGATNRDIYLSFDQISAERPELDRLSAATLADYMSQVAQESA
jgi:acyl carrier protein